MLPLLLALACTKGGDGGDTGDSGELKNIADESNTLALAQWNIGLESQSEYVVDFVTNNWVNYADSWGGIEIWAEGKFDDLVDATQAYYVHSYYSNDETYPNPNDSDGDDTAFGAGLGVFADVIPFNVYTVPYIGEDGFALCDDSDCTATKGIVVEQFVQDGEIVAVLTTHLQANNEGDVGRGQEIRIQQLEILADEINLLRASGVRYIFVRGDFNISLDPYNGEEVALDDFMDNVEFLSEVCDDITCEDYEDIKAEANAIYEDDNDDLVWGNYDHFFYSADTVLPISHEYFIPTYESDNVSSTEPVEKNISDHVPRLAVFELI